MKEAALAAKRYAANRLALSPRGDLDLFFNDRHSLTKAAEDLGTLGSELPGIPALIRSRRGLLCRPRAAADSLFLAASLGERLKTSGSRRTPPFRRSRFTAARPRAAWTAGRPPSPSSG
ncbi:MAG: hypothetical protein LBR53_02100 [Deltaproteobacteria bacterium]|nr:hypothetical protein [Deltaproteobacteria bacterium]